MSKKPQPQNKENPKNRPQIVEQQNEPFLKTLQKKVRNINKKLTQITELEAKENLKPEQVEKINRKAALIEERARVEQTATLFKETYAENAAIYRGIQLRELEVLARAIAIFHTGAKLPESDKLANLWHALEQTENFSTLNEVVNSLSNSLKDFANDRKLQKALTTYVQEHGNDKIAPIVSNEAKIVSDVLEEKVEVKPEPVAVVPEKAPAPVADPAPVPAPVVVATSVPEPKVEVPVVAEKVEEAPVVAVEAQTTPLPEATQPKTEEKPAEQRDKRRNNRGENNRGENNRGGRGEYKGNRERREGEEPRERRQYKPKYSEKEPVQQEQRQEEKDDSSDSEPEVRNFRKEEIRQLEEEGFIVITKPKPKAKDQREQRKAHDQEHGRKPHHHHGPK